jgi:hypothetical protein
MEWNRRHIIGNNDLSERLTMKTNLKLSKLFFRFIGLGALLWFLIRVIRKSSRAAFWFLDPRQFYSDPKF